MHAFKHARANINRWFRKQLFHIHITGCPCREDIFKEGQKDTTKIRKDLENFPKKSLSIMQLLPCCYEHMKFLDFNLNLFSFKKN